MKEVLEILMQLLSKPLPGAKAQELMSPPNRYAGMESPHQEPAIESSVFIILFMKDCRWYLPLIQRTKYNGIHSGQISLPGGKYEESDIDLLHTAYRETEEEIGISADMITYAGTLSGLYIPRSNFSVIPHVGILTSVPLFKPNNREVEKVITLPFEVLFDKSYVRHFKRVVNGIQITAPCYQYGEYRIWGATAMMLSELVEIIKDSPLAAYFSGHQMVK